jgi:hypothetical protein
VELRGRGAAIGPYGFLKHYVVAAPELVWPVHVGGAIEWFTREQLYVDVLFVKPGSDRDRDCRIVSDY